MRSPLVFLQVHSAVYAFIVDRVKEEAAELFWLCLYTMLVGGFFFLFLLLLSHVLFLIRIGIENK